MQWIFNKMRYQKCRLISTG